MLKNIAVFVTLLATTALSQDKSFTLQTPSTLTETGFIRHLLPRFSLKSGIGIKTTLGAGDAAFECKHAVAGGQRGQTAAVHG